MIDKKIFEQDFVIKSWDDVKDVFDDLLKKEISSKDELEDFIYNLGCLHEKMEEDYAWTYINMTRDTTNEEYTNAYKNFNENILPNYEKYAFEFNKKIVNSPFIDQIDKETFGEIVKKTKLSIEIFREKNIPLKTKVSELSSDYQKIIGTSTVNFQGKDYTLAQMRKFFMDKNRDVRKEAFEATMKVMLANNNKINEIFSKLTDLRQEMAKNAGFDNYRDFRFKELQRTDYTVEDTKKFHESVQNAALPVYAEFWKIKKDMLGLDKLYPYDKSAIAENEVELKPFESTEEFVEKTIQVFSKVKPEFGDIIKSIYEKKYLDLDNRKGKAPGGYNYPLYKTGMPFIFMNAIGIHSDMRTLMHEGGHAVHTVSTKSQFPYYYKGTPSEVAELASMSMELLTMEYWDIFYKDEKALKQAKREQLEQILTFFPWCAIVDKFQHWIYENKNHTAEERNEYFAKLMLEFGEDNFDWSDYNDYLKVRWQRQLHIIEVPFYYIEYGMAQLGAVQVWKNYLENGQKAVEQYHNALKLGSSKPIPEIYKEAGIEFNFSNEKMSELLNFAFNEYKKLV